MNQRTDGNVGVCAVKYLCWLTGVCVWARAGEDEHSRRNLGRSQILEDLNIRQGIQLLFCISCALLGTFTVLSGLI